MPRGGLSSNAAAKQRQLDGLARGREKQARRVLGLDEEDGGAATPPAATTPAAPPRASAKPRASKTRKGAYGKPRPKPRKEAGSARPASGDPPEPEQRPGRGGFLGSLIGGITDL